MVYPGKVTVAAPEGSTLGVVLHAALAARAWTVTLFIGVPPRFQKPSSAGRPESRTVVIIEDDDGIIALRFPGTFALHDLVCLGSINSIDELIRLASRGAMVLNQAAPILVLLDLIQEALMAPPGANRGEVSTDDRLVELVERQSEAQRLARLTTAENEALRGVLAGLSATEIALHSHHSVHTIRSQIKAILGKLGVRTQVSAVAVTHRSASYRWLYAGLATFTNFGDDPATGQRPS